MGWFGKKEKTHDLQETSSKCPICGGDTGLFFNSKIKDGQVLCMNCSEKVSMDLSLLSYQSVEDMKSHLEYRERNYEMHLNFNIQKNQPVGTHSLKIDDAQKLWYYSSKKDMNPPIFRFDEILDYEFNEDGQTVTKGGLGRAVVGGALFGGVGAVVGGITGKKKSKTFITSMKIRISLKNKYHHQIVLDFNPTGSKLQSGSFAYNQYLKEVESTLSLLDYMCAQANCFTENPQGISSFSAADEILKYKQLLDMGAITKEEFDAKKAQLLEL